MKGKILPFQRSTQPFFILEIFVNKPVIESYLHKHFLSASIYRQMTFNRDHQITGKE